MQESSKFVCQICWSLANVILIFQPQFATSFRCIWEPLGGYVGDFASSAKNALQDAMPPSIAKAGPT